MNMLLFSLFWLVPSISSAAMPPTPFPIFLKAGFSAVLEFEEAPSRVVLGDGQSFQVERLERSLVVKTLTPYAASNMFVYFREQQPRLFMLTASEDAAPTNYKKFENPISETSQKENSSTHNSSFNGSFTGGRLISAQFDAKKDYLSVDVEISSDKNASLKPRWKLVRLAFNNGLIIPFKLWAQRKDVQRDSSVRARFIFVKPNVPRNLKGVSLIVPLLGVTTPIRIQLTRGVKGI